jgi:hypothetical protein
VKYADYDVPSEKMAIVAGKFIPLDELATLEIAKNAIRLEIHLRYDEQLNAPSVYRTK